MLGRSMSAKKTQCIQDLLSVEVFLDISLKQTNATLRDMNSNTALHADRNLFVSYRMRHWNRMLALFNTSNATNL